MIFSPSSSNTEIENKKERGTDFLSSASVAAVQQEDADSKDLASSVTATVSVRPKSVFFPKQPHLLLLLAEQ